ncbi:MAG: hypothetical protein LAO19_04610 [Acidobacteriia bacterium]|nr:hypothetical protein [Terriglobia bacterium]
MIVISLVLLIAVMGFYCATRGIFAAVDSSAGPPGSRFVTCPETAKPAVVSVAVGTMSPAGYRVLDRMRLGECSRWPMRQECSQSCIKQLE